MTKCTNENSEDDITLFQRIREIRKNYPDVLASEVSKMILDEDALMMAALGSLAIEHPNEPLYKFDEPGCITLRQFRELRNEKKD